MVFLKKWFQNHPQFLLHFLIHIDVLMLCRKFELIPTKIPGVMAIFKNWLIFEKYPVLCFFSKKWLKIHPPPPIFITFSDVLMSLCYVESLI